MSNSAPLRELCDLLTDGTHYTPPDVDEGIPFLTVKDVSERGLDFVDCAKITQNEYAAAARQNSTPLPGDILFSKDGTVGKVHLVTEEQPFVVLSSLAIIRPKAQIDARYLAHFLRSPSALNAATQRKTGSAIRRIVLRDLSELLVPLIPLDEQRRIAAILDQADALRRSADAFSNKFERLLEAFYFVATNSCDVAAVPVRIDSIVRSMRTGPFGSQLLHSEFVDDGIAVLGIDNAVQNRFAWGERRFITERKFEGLKRYRVFPRDLIVTIMGTCGRAAIVPDDIPVAITTKHLCCITLDTSQCLPEFLHAALIYDREVLRQLGVSERGAVMPGLNMELIKRTMIRLPSIDLQQRFASQVRELRDAQTRANRQVAGIERLFQCLSTGLFENGGISHPLKLQREAAE